MTSEAPAPSPRLLNTRETLVPGPGTSWGLTPGPGPSPRPPSASAASLITRFLSMTAWSAETRSGTFCHRLNCDIPRPLMIASKYTSILCRNHVSLQNYLKLTNKLYRDNNRSGFILHLHYDFRQEQIFLLQIIAS